MAGNFYDLPLVDDSEEEQPQQPQEPSRWSAAADQMLGRSSSTLRLSTDEAAKTSPEIAAQIQRMADHFRVPPSIVAGSFDRFKAKYDADQVVAQTSNTPTTANWLTNPQNNAVSRDDVDSLTILEKLLRAGRSMIPQTLGGLVTGTARVGAAAVRMGAELPQVPEELRNYARELRGDPFAAARARPEPNAVTRGAMRASSLAEQVSSILSGPRRTGLEGMAQNAFESIGQMVPAYFGGALMRTPEAAAWLSAAAMGLQTGALAYEQGRTPPEQQPPRKAPGQLELGNVDLYAQPAVANPETGGVSTVFAESFNFDGKEVLLPRVTPDGRFLTSDQAVEEYKRTGRNLGVFETPEAATAYAQQLHEDYAAGKYAQRPQGLGVVASLLFGATQASTELWTEYLPAKVLFKELSHNVPLLVKLAHEMGSEVVGEELATFFQDMAEFVALPANKDRTWQDFWNERGDAAIATAVSTLISAGGITLGAHLTAKVLEDAGKTLQKSKAFQRAPQTIEDLMALMDNSKRFLPLDTFTTYWQQQGVNPKEKAAELTGDPHAYDNAVKSGGIDLAVPTPRYLAVIGADEKANTFFADEVRTEVKLGPGGPTVAWNRREAQEYLKAYAAQPAETPPTATPTPEQARLEQVYAQIYGAHVERLVKIGMPRDEAEQNAVLAASFFTNTLAARGGIDAVEQYARLQQVVRQEGPTAATTLEQEAYHGSPHIFDEFSLHKIGTGQGAQSYGWGLYFAGKKEVAQGYREQLSRGAPREIRLKGERPALGTFLAAHLFNIATDVERGHTFSEAKRTAISDLEYIRDNRSADLDPHDKKELLRAIEQIRDANEGDIVRSKPGRTYTVEIPEDEDFLAWDKPLSEQSPKVQAAVKALGVDVTTVLRGAPVADPTGAQIYDALADRLIREQPDVPPSWKVVSTGVSAPRLASEALAKQGVAGIRYLDQLSRAKGEGTSNYVVFDDKLAKITRYEQPARPTGPTTLYQPAKKGKPDKDTGLQWNEIAPVRMHGDAPEFTTAVPTSVDATKQETPSRADLKRVLDATAAGSDIAQRMADVVKTHGILTNAELAAATTPEEVLELFVQRMHDNLRFLWNLADPEFRKQKNISWEGHEKLTTAFRERAKLWYEGAHRIARELQLAYKITVAQAGGVMAVLSPRADWFRNVELAKRLIKWRDQFDAANPTFEAKLIKQYEKTQKAAFAIKRKGIVKKHGEEAAARREEVFKKELATDRRRLKDKAWLDLVPEDQARMLRAADELEGKMVIPQIAPEGDVGPLVMTKEQVSKSGKVTPGRPAKLTWQSYPQIANGLDILRSQDLKVIHERIGFEHKVRSFINNIVAPWSDFSVTIDTHAIAAALLMPLGLKSVPVDMAMGGPADNLAGLSGTSALYAEAYFRLAKELGVLPREVQSVTWEIGRGLFRPEQKNEKIQAVVDALWADHASGKISIDDVRAGVVAAVGGVAIPAWFNTPPRVAGEQGGGAARLLHAQPRSGGELAPGRADVSGPLGAAAGTAGTDAQGLAGDGAAERTVPGDVKKTLYQPEGPDQPKQPRAAFDISQEREFAIRLFKNRDVSSLAHESAHMMLELFGDLVDTLKAVDPARLTEEQRGLVTDYDAVLKFLDVGERGAIKEEHHEKFARAWEAYLREGKAPTKALRGVFNYFGRWLTSLYRTVDELHVEMTPEIRQVFDRFLASDEAIAQTERESGIQQAFVSPEQAGMSAFDFQPYREALAEESVRAREDMVNRLVDRQLGEQRRARQAERAKIRTEVEADLAQHPVYRAETRMRDAGLKFAKADLEGFTPGEIATLGRRGLMTALEDGISPDVIAEQLGFPSGVALVRSLLSVPSKQTAIDDAVERQMTARHGDPLDPDAVRALADEAVHGIHRQRVVNFELGALAKMVEGATVPNAEEIQRFVEQRIANMPIEDLRPSQYLQAAQRASREAFDLIQSGRDLKAALRAKANETIALAHYREARAILNDAEDVAAFWSEHLYRPDKAMAETREMNYINAARYITSGILDRPQSLERAKEALATLEEYDPQVHENVMAYVGAAPFGKSLGKMTVEEFRTARDVVFGLWDISKRETEIRVAGKLMKKADAITALRERLKTRHGEPKYGRIGITGAPSKFDVMQREALGVEAWGRRIESWTTAMDGGPTGPFKSYLHDPVKDAINDYRVETVEYKRKYRDLFKPIQESLKAREKIPAPELWWINAETGQREFYTFGQQGSGAMAEVLGALLQTGNRTAVTSNMAKLLIARQWGEFREDGTLDTTKWDAFIARMWQEGKLTKAHYDFNQGVMNMFEELKPGLQETHKQVYGYYFVEVKPDPIVTPWGTYPGGYAPAIVDPLISQAQALKNEKQMAFEKGTSFAVPSVGRRSTIERVKFFEPLAMNLTFIPQHIDWALRFKHIQPAVRDVSRVVTDPTFRKVLDAYEPMKASHMLMPWLMRSATQRLSERGANPTIDKIATAIRSRTALQILAWSVNNALQQPAGIFLVLSRVEKKRTVANATWRYVTAFREVGDEIRQKSKFMRVFLDNEALELDRQAKEILLNPNVFAKAKQFVKAHAQFMAGITQNIVNHIAWVAGYDEANQKGLHDDDAVRYADNMVRETQGTPYPEDLSRYEVNTPTMRLLGMFGSYFNMQANLQLTQTQTAKQPDRGSLAYAARIASVWTLGYLVPNAIANAVLNAIKGDWDDDDDDTHIDEVLNLFFSPSVRTAFSSMPIVGQFLTAGFNTLVTDQTYDDTVRFSPSASIIENILKDLSGKSSKKQVAKDALSVLGMMADLPLGPLGRPLGFLLDVEEGKAQPENAYDWARGLTTGYAPKKR